MKDKSQADKSEVNEVDDEDDDLDAFTVSLLDDFDQGMLLTSPPVFQNYSCQHHRQYHLNSATALIT